MARTSPTARRKRSQSPAEEAAEELVPERPRARASVAAVKARQAGEALDREALACLPSVRTYLFLQRRREMEAAPHPAPGQKATQSARKLLRETKGVCAERGNPGVDLAGPPIALEGAEIVSSLWNQSSGRLQKVYTSETTEETAPEGKPIIHKVIHRPCDRRTSEQRSRQSSALLAANGKLTTANLAWRLRRALSGGTNSTTPSLPSVLHRSPPPLRPSNLR